MAQPETIDKPRRWRRICWYSLAVLVLTLIGLYAFAFWHYEQRQAAIAGLEPLGGNIEIEPGGPEWFRGVLGDERMKVFDRVELVDINRAEITDGGMRHLSGLTSLEFLYLSGTRITDDGVRHLSRLTNLEELDLSNTQITDDGLKYLSGLTRLQLLWIKKTQITDDGEKSLQGALPNCYIGSN